MGALSLVLSLMSGFFTGGASVIASFVSCLLGSRVGLTMLGLAGLFTLGFYFGFSHERKIVLQLRAETEAKIEAAIKARDEEWTSKLAAANAENEERLKEALDAGKNVAHVPASPGDLAKLCEADPSCRGALDAKQRVPNASRKLVPRRLKGDDKPHPKPSGGLLGALP